jgi:uncharacterized MAPEG superfamily protein
MTTPLWCLLGFVAWTLFLLFLLGVSRVSKVVAGTAQPNQFPAGVPHGSDAYWRLNRAHLNCVENLPVFASLVLTATVAGIRAGALDTLARVVLGARLGQSLAHLSSGGNLAVNVRFAFFLTQLACYVLFMVTIWRAG